VAECQICRANLLLKSNRGLASGLSTTAKVIWKATFGPEDVFAYIYAVLNSPSYQSRYFDFLKLDFPELLWFPRKSSL